MNLDPKWRLALLGLGAALWPLAPSWEPAALDPCDHLATAIAFLLVIPWACGRLFAALGLPRVSAYMLAGIAGGPFVLGLLRAEVVSDLKVLDDVALFLIAFLAGGELRRGILARRLGTLVSVSWRVAAAGAAAAAVVAFLCRNAISFLPGMTSSQALLAVVMLALVVTSRSPATTMAVLLETRARGPLSLIFLGVSILVDVALLILLSILLSVGAGFMPGGAAAVEGAWGGRGGVALSVAAEVLGSIGAGALVGGLTVAGQRRLGAAPGLFLPAAGCALLALCHALGLQIVLGAVVAGWMTANLAPHGEAILEFSRRVSPPVFLLFFALAGAAINLRSLRLMIGPALALAAARLGAQWLAVRWARAGGGAGDLLRGPAFLGFLPQSVISLGLVVLVERQFPGWGSEFAALAAAAIAVNMLAGPPALKHALEAAGEIAAPAPAPERQPALASGLAG